MTAIPKPSREDRRKSAIDTSGLALAKRHFDRDALYRRWISEIHRCALPNHEVRCGATGDRKPVEAAHLDHGGQGVKGSDASCIPLCPRHHDMLDAETLPWQIVAILWKKAWELREEWHRRGSRG